MLSGKCHCGAVRWSFDGVPKDATSCNCTVCRRYGTLWAYDYDGERIRIEAQRDVIGTYVRGDRVIGFHFCKACACVTHWRSQKVGDDGRTRIAVNLRMAEPQAVASIPLQRFDGLVSWNDLPSDGRCVADMWF